MSDKCPKCGLQHLKTKSVPISELCRKQGAFVAPKGEFCLEEDGEACLRRQLAALKEENAELKGVCRKGLDALLSIRAAGDYTKAEGVSEAIVALREAAEENPHA